MSNSMSFSTANLANLIDQATSKAGVAKKQGAKNAQYYKERLEAHVDALADSSNPDVRLEVASSEFASSSLLKRMLEVECEEKIVGIILSHPNLSKTVKVEFTKKNLDLVKKLIANVEVEGSATEEFEESMK